MTAPTRPPVVSAAPRLQARRRAERRRALRRWLRRGGYGALGLLPVALLTWVVLSSPLFDVDRVEVVGAASPDAVREAAGIDEGRPLARVDTARAQERVAALASIAEVTVSRRWPGTVRISVVERTPLATVAVRGGGFRLLASDGTPYATVPKRPAGVVSLAVPPPGPSAQDPTTRAALDVLAEVSPAIRSRTTSLSATSPQRVVLVVRGRVVVWGAPGERAAEKSRVVQVLLGRPGRQIDVAAPGVATVTGAP